MQEKILQQLRHYCAYQERCHSEVKQKLYSLGIWHTEADAIIAQLIEESFLNEERFAKAYAGGKFRMKQWGRNKIKQSLKQKQVSDYCIKKGLQEIDEEKYLQTIKMLAAKKYQSLRREQYLKRKYKTQQYLMQKGFEPDIVKEVVEQIINYKT